MKISEISYPQLFADARITDYYFDCEAKDTLLVIGRDLVAGHRECEETFNAIREKIMQKYGDVEIEMHLPTNLDGRWPIGKIEIVDAKYQADKAAYIEAKGRALAAWGYTD